MSTPDTDGKKVPPFTSFRLAPAIQKADSCCCEEHCASSAPVSTAVAGTRYTWKISGMDCAPAPEKWRMRYAKFAASTRRKCCSPPKS